MKRVKLVAARYIENIVEFKTSSRLFLSFFSTVHEPVFYHFATSETERVCGCLESVLLT